MPRRVSWRNDDGVSPLAVVHPIPAKRSPLARRLGYQSLEKMRSRRRGPVSPDKLYILAHADTVRPAVTTWKSLMKKR